jgi:tetratricopeptide (TPR) repeat protein
MASWVAILALIIAGLTSVPAAMAIDLAPLWDFDKPDLSERRFRTAQATATGDDAFILQTQIARTYGLRRDFTKAREILKSLEPRIPAAGPDARVRYALELGRTYASATHPPESQTAEAKARARTEYLRAYELAKSERLDGLAVDALPQPSAKKWEASLRNNVGYALHRLGRFEEALANFRQAVVLRERGKDAEATRAAHWMVAWTLRALHRTDDALEIQSRLERECEAAGAPALSVLEELELLYRAKGDEARASQYAKRRKALAK